MINLENKVELFTAMIKAQSGVLYVTGEPATGKTAIFRQIAKNEGWNLVDKRLGQIDESEVIGIPKTKEIDGVSVMSYAIPEYAFNANKRPTLIVFDELNRALLPVRNASLQLLNERQIGDDFYFNENVYMVALGNLGDEDGTEVEEFDTALNSRLIHFRHVLTIPEWVNNFAKANVIPSIVSFVENNPQHFNRIKKGEEDGSVATCAYANPRTWTFLSKAIETIYGKNPSIQDFLPFVKKQGMSYIGTSVTKFIRYLEDISAINVNNVINDFSSVEDSIKKFNRDRKSELLNELKKTKIVDLSAKQLNNVSNFLKILEEDEQVSYLNFLIDSKQVTKESLDIAKVKTFLSKFKEIFKKVNNFS
jgi:flagellar biosynthesis chaperone FliJ